MTFKTTLQYNYIKVSKNSKSAGNLLNSFLPESGWVSARLFSNGNYFFKNQIFEVFKFQHRLNIDFILESG